MTDKRKAELMEVFHDIYKKFYDNPDEVIELDQSTLTRIGDALIAKDKEFLKEMVDYRGDIFSSDREVAAFAVIYLFYITNATAVVKKGAR